MIIYDLVCEFEHEFEGWFKTSDDLKAQQANGLLQCPFCDSPNVIKKLSAVKLTKKSNQASSTRSSQQGFISSDDTTNVDFQHVQELLTHVNDFIDENFQDVGDKFAETADSMHSGDKEPVNIKGTATQKELQELTDSGIDVLAIPPKPISKKKLN